MLVQMSATYKSTKRTSLFLLLRPVWSASAPAHLDIWIVRWSECDKATYPLRKWQTPLLRTHSCTILIALFGLSNGRLHLRIVLEPARRPPSASPGLICCPSKMIPHRRPQPTGLGSVKRSWHSTTL